VFVQSLRKGIRQLRLVFVFASSARGGDAGGGRKFYKKDNGVR